MSTNVGKCRNKRGNKRGTNVNRRGAVSFAEKELQNLTELKRNYAAYLTFNLCSLTPAFHI